MSVNAARLTGLYPQIDKTAASISGSRLELVQLIF